LSGGTGRVGSVFESRLRIVFALGVLYFVVLIGRLFTMQVLDAEDWRERSRQLSRSRISIAARRGEILDRNGEILAADRQEWDLMIRLDNYDGSSWRCRRCGCPAVSTDKDAPSRCLECRNRTFDAGPKRDDTSLAAMLGMTADEYSAAMRAVRKDCDRHVAREVKRLKLEPGSKRRPRVVTQFRGWLWTLARGVPAEAVKEVSLAPQRHRGLVIRSIFRRARPAGDSIASLVGRVGKASSEDVDGLRKKGFSFAEIYRLRLGRTGVEKALEERLAAHSGYRIVTWDARGRDREILKEEPARDGETVRLALDLALQDHMTKELKRVGRSLGAHGAFFSALDPETGEVLVFAGWGKPDRGILLDRQSTVPGSIFKVVTAIAGVESNELDPTELFECTGRWHRIGCHGSVHGAVDLADALAVSCNGYFGNAADVMGIDILSWWSRYLGFGAPTGLEISREASGLVPDPQWKMERYESSESFRKAFTSGHWQRGETWQVGFGQGALLVTPIQVARLMAIVANGGYAVRPTLLAGKGARGERILEPRTIALVRDGLEEVVNRGTASKTGLIRFRAAGKTGTGDLPRGKEILRNVAWFAGYAPAEAPKIAFACCFVDVKGYGGGVAGPVCVEFLDEFTKP